MATEKTFGKLAARTERAKDPLRERDRIGIAVGKVVDPAKMGKHF
jgi:hypothetical protein